MNVYIMDVPHNNTIIKKQKNVN